MPPVAGSVVGEMGIRVIRSHLVAPFESFVNPSTHFSWVIAPIVDGRETTLDIVVKPGRYRVGVILARIGSRARWQDDAKEPRTGAMLGISDTGADLPVDMFALPRLSAD